MHGAVSALVVGNGLLNPWFESKMRTQTFCTLLCLALVAVGSWAATERSVLQGRLVWLLQHQVTCRPLV
jgi:hypothetical protein